MSVCKGKHSVSKWECSSCSFIVQNTCSLLISISVFFGGRAFLLGKSFHMDLSCLFIGNPSHKEGWTGATELKPFPRCQQHCHNQNLVPRRSTQNHAKKQGATPKLLRLFPADLHLPGVKGSDPRTKTSLSLGERGSKGKPKR